MFQTLVGWLERGECNKKNANTFYSLIQASNNQIRRLFNVKMVLDEEYHTIKVSMKEKFAHVLLQCKSCFIRAEGLAWRVVRTCRKELSRETMLDLHFFKTAAAASS